MSDHPVDRIELSIPPHVQHAATLRVLVAALGADAGFSIDEIDDVRLGVSEVFAALTEHAPNERVRVAIVPDDGLDITMSSESQASVPEFDALAGNILHAVFDQFGTGPDGVRMVKRAVEAASVHGSA